MAGAIVASGARSLLDPTCPPITASLEAIGDHHGSEEANDLIGGDDPCYSGKYTHQESNLKPSAS